MALVLWSLVCPQAYIHKVGHSERTCMKAPADIVRPTFKMPLFSRSASTAEAAATMPA